MPSKVCSRREKCQNGNRPQPYSNFAKDSVAKDGHKSQCNDCTATLRKEKKQQQRDIFHGRFSMFIGNKL